MIGKLSDEEMEEVLQKNVYGRIGCHDNGRTYVVPVNYAYDGKDVICHSVYGTKIQMMRRNPAICFQVDEITDFMNWKSVILWGEYQEILKPADRYRAMSVFVDRMLSLKISETAVLPENVEAHMQPHMPGLIKPIIYRFVILERSGRYEAE